MNVLPIELQQMIYDFADIEGKVSLNKIFGHNYFYHRRVKASSCLEACISEMLMFRFADINMKDEARVVVSARYTIWN